MFFALNQKKLASRIMVKAWVLLNFTNILKTNMSFSIIRILLRFEYLSLY